MSDPLALFCSVALDAGDFRAFLAGLGGSLDPGSSTRGTVSEGDCHAWLFFSPAAVREATEEHGDALRLALGGRPTSAIVVETSRDPDGRTLALMIAAVFAERWPPAVLDDQGALVRL